MKSAKFIFEYEPPQRRQLGLLVRCALILPPAFLLSLKYDLPHILILTALMVVFPIFQDRSFRLRDSGQHTDPRQTDKHPFHNRLTNIVEQF